MTRALQCICQWTGCPFPANRVRLVTAYTAGEKNWAWLCLFCEEEANEYWRERWDDYYADVIPAYPYS